jgi:Fic family protein
LTRAFSRVYSIGMSKSHAVPYVRPLRWIKFNALEIVSELTEAKAAVLSLTTIPYQRSWVDKLQVLQLKREVAGTSRIEGADFTDNELDIAMQESPEELLTRSQRQAHAVAETYRWIAKLPDDRPIDSGLICEVHARIIKGADDDRCEPGRIRGVDQNVTFGLPLHRGAEGGRRCEEAFEALGAALADEFNAYDVLIQALALHYHIGAIHPFLDGHGRTARALEALVLRRAGLKDTLFIAMSNYYYDEKPTYLQTLSEVRAVDHDLTSFLKLGLRGIALQCKRLLNEIRPNVAKALFRDMMYDLFERLETPRKRVIRTRQIEILKLLLEHDELPWMTLVGRTRGLYRRLSNPKRAIVRDVNALLELEAITVRADDKDRFYFSINIDWPSEITESRFFDVLKRLPKAKTRSFGT